MPERLASTRFGERTPLGKRDSRDYNNEPVYQWGRFGSGRIRAWIVASDAGYLIESSRWHPPLRFEADTANLPGVVESNNGPFLQSRSTSAASGMIHAIGSSGERHAYRAPQQDAAPEPGRVIVPTSRLDSQRIATPDVHRRTPAESAWLPRKPDNWSRRAGWPSSPLVRDPRRYARTCSPVSTKNSTPSFETSSQTRSAVVTVTRRRCLRHQGKETRFDPVSTPCVECECAVGFYRSAGPPARAAA